MADKFTVKITGLAEVMNALRTMPEAMKDIRPQGLKAAAGYIITILQRTVRTWRHRVSFKARAGQGITSWAGAGLNRDTFEVETEDAIWNMLNRGTRAHTIAAKPSNPTGRLHFRQGGFVPKTRVQTFNSYPGAQASGPWRHPRSVWHPGTKAREWYSEAEARFGGKAREIAQDKVVDLMYNYLQEKGLGWMVARYKR